MSHLDYCHSALSLLPLVYPYVFLQHCSRCILSKPKSAHVVPLFKPLQWPPFTQVQAQTLTMTCEVIWFGSITSLASYYWSPLECFILDTLAPSRFLWLSGYILTSAPFSLGQSDVHMFFPRTLFKPAFKCHFPVKEHLFQIIIPTSSIEFLPSPFI